MEIIISPTADAASALAARYIAQQIRKKPRYTLGLATGSTPCGLYAELARMHREENLDLKELTTFNLDEYVGLPANHPASYHRFMAEHFFSLVNIPVANQHIPDGLTTDIPQHCQEYEAAIQSVGGIDLQILGLGSDGHLGFNEPSSSFASRTRIKTLTEQTLRDNARFFEDEKDVPHHVITMGLGTIMESRICLLLAFGKAKAHAVALSCEGPVTASVPGSLLQFHPQAKVFLDEESASELIRADYYRWVYLNKPKWDQLY